MIFFVLFRLIFGSEQRVKRGRSEKERKKNPNFNITNTMVPNMDVYMCACDFVMNARKLSAGRLPDTNHFSFIRSFSEVWHLFSFFFLKIGKHSFMKNLIQTVDQIWREEILIVIYLFTIYTVCICVCILPNQLTRVYYIFLYFDLFTFHTYGIGAKKK